MNNWSILSKKDYDYVWDKFYAEFSFKPSIYESDWPTIQTDKPNFKFSIKNLFGDSYNELIDIDFLQKAIDTFIEITIQEEEIFALDWKHECYYINPRKLTPNIMIGLESSISFIPNGDYYIFLTKDFENIWFGHPWENTVTIIGTKLINSFKKTYHCF